jgi:hypothetical protein
MIRDVCALRRGGGARAATPAKPNTSPEGSPEPEAVPGGRTPSVVLDAGRAVSTAYIPSEPYFYYKPEFTDLGLTRFLASTVRFHKYEPCEAGIRKVAQQLANVKLNADGSHTRTFDNGFEVLERSRYLIAKYAAYMRKGKFDIDTDAKREIVVVAEIEDLCHDSDAQAGLWLEYLHLFGTGDLGSAKTRFEREVAPGEVGKPSDDVTTDPKDVFFEFKAGGTDVPESPTSSRKKSVVTKSIIGAKEGDKSRDLKNRANERRKKVLQGMREHQASTKTGPEPATAATVLTIDDQRQLLYDEDQSIKDRWSKYSGQITTLAGHLEVLLEDDRKFFDEVGTNSVQDRVNGNDYTGVLYRYIEDYRKNYPNDYQLLVDRFKFKILADEYVIIHAMEEDVQEIEVQSADKDFCIDLQYWIDFLSKMEKNVTDKTALSLMKLGSELHTFPADASLDLMQNLTRRLEALQDW